MKRAGRIQGLSVNGGTVTSVLDVSRTIKGDASEIDRGCEVTAGGTVFEDVRQQLYRDAATLMQQVPDDDGQRQP